MKRKLALFLVLAMILSLVPANVFAATANSVNKIPTVADDFEFDAANAPTLRIEEDNDDEFAGEAQTFVLVLTNAEWDADDEGLIEGYAQAGTVALDATYISATKMQIELTSDAGGAAEFAKIPLVAELQGEGLAKVTIDAKDSALTEGTYTFAKGAAGSTTATIDDTTTFRDTAEMENIVIEENVVDTFANDTTEITLKLLDSDFVWEDDGANFAINFSGGFAPADVDYEIDDNVMTVTVTGIYGGGAGVTRGTVTFEGLEVNPDSDASFGDVKVKVYGDDVTDETLTIGKYVDYTVVAEADDDDSDLPTLYAGKLDDGYKLAALEDVIGGVVDGTDLDAEDDDVVDAVEAIDGEANELSQLNIFEDVAKSWVISRETKVTFPDWVKIIDVDVADFENIAVDGVEATEEDITDALTYDPGDNSVSFENLEAWDEEDTMEIDLQFYVSVEADASGDIVAEVSGKAIGETFKVKLGTAVAPVKAVVEVKDVKIGMQDQATGKIAITEYEDAVIADGSEVTVTLDAEDGMEWSATPEAEVVKGDMEIDDVEKDGEVVTVTVDNESSETSTFEVTGLEVDVNRTVSEGDYNVTIGGDALVMNYEEDGDSYFFDTDNVVDTKYVRVITPAPGDTQAGEKVVFTIGSMDYMIGAVKVTGDVAPYINEQGRTMLPLRAMANALGVTDANILWNDAEHSVTIFKGDATVKVIIGQMSFMKNGVMMPMDTTAVIMNSRTMLPLRAIAQALGAEVLWDEATRTVTVQ